MMSVVVCPISTAKNRPEYWSQHGNITKKAKNALWVGTCYQTTGS